MTVIPLPTPAYQYGKVVGRVVHAIADTASDVDQFPEGRPAQGKVTFKPRETLRVVTSPNDQAAFVTHEPVEANLDSNGRIIDAEGRDGIWLVTGTYDVSFQVTRVGAPKLPPVVVTVTAGHTTVAPFDLTAAASYVPPAGASVQTLQVPSGWSPGQFLAAGTGGSLTWTTGAVSDEMVTDLAGAAFPTVAAMVAANPPLGTVTQTLGYYEAGDGGACRYIVQGSALKSYDIAGAGVAFRPAVNGTIHPKQFGTINNGVALDNLKLQACYDYAADLGIATIDGQGLTYTIGTVNPYDENRLGFAHTGAIVDSGRRLINFKFRTAEGSTNGTVACSVRMLDNGEPTYLENIEIDGNLTNLTVNDSIGKGDGGCHGIHLYHPSSAVAVTPIEDRDFYPCGDVYLNGVTIKNVYSYGGRADFLDCTVRITDCTFETRGISWLCHSTKTIVDGARVERRSGRAGKVMHPFLSEMEFDDNYSGSKRQSFEFRRVRYGTDLTESVDAALLGVAYAPMQGVHFDRVIFDDCHSTTGGLFKVSASGASTNPDPIQFNIGRLEVHNCTTGTEAVSVASPLSTAPTNLTVRVEDFRYQGKKGPGFIRLIGLTTVGQLTFDDPAFVDNGRIVATGGTVIENLTVNNIQSPDMGVNGILRDTTATATINKLVMRGGYVRMLGSSLGLFDCNISELRVNDLRIDPNESGQHSRIAMIRNAKAEITLRDILLTGTAYRSSSFPLIYSTTMNDGFLHMRNVRHRTMPAEPVVSVAALATSRVVKDSVAPLYT